MKRILIRLIACMFVSSLHAAITFDAAINTSGTGIGFTQPYTVGSGLNRMLVVAVKTLATGVAPSSVQYDGVAMTFVTRTAATGMSNEIWVLKDPHSGGHNVVAAFTGSAAYVVGIESYSEVSTYGSYGVFHSDSSNYASVTVTTGTDNSWVVSSGLQTSNNTLTFPAGSVTRSAQSSGSTPKFSSVSADRLVPSAGSANVFMASNGTAGTCLSVVELLAASPTPTVTMTNTKTATPTVTSTITMTNTKTATPTITLTSTLTPTPSPAVWKVYGGAGEDIGYVSYALDNENIIIAGSTTSFGSGAHDGYAMLVDTAGNCIWAHTYGGAGNEYFYDANECTITARIGLVGTTTSFAGGYQQGYLMIVDYNGNCITSTTAGGFGAGTSALAGVRHRTSDDTWWIAGETDRSGAGSSDMLLCNIDKNGNVVSQKTLGGPNEDVGEDVVIDNNGYIYVGGYTNSFGAGNYDFYVVKLNQTGTVVLDYKTYGTALGDEFLYTMYYDSIGDDLLLTGWQVTNDGNGTIKAYAVHIETDLSTSWIRNTGDTGFERYARWGQPYFSTYVSVGSKNNTPSGSFDAGLVQVTDAGITNFERLYGGNDFDEFWSVSHPDGYIAMVGSTKSYAPNPTPGASPLAGDGKKHIYFVLEPDTYIPTPTPMPTKTPIPQPTNYATQCARQTAVAQTATATWWTRTVTETATPTMTETVTITATYTVSPTRTPGTILMTTENTRALTLTVNTLNGSASIAIPGYSSWYPEYNIFIQVNNLPANTLYYYTQMVNSIVIYVIKPDGSPADCTSDPAEFDILIQKTYGGP